MDRCSPWFLMAIILGTLCRGVIAQSTKVGEAPPAKASPPPAVSSAKTIDPEREATLLSFVREHHAELAPLLEPLKTQDPKKYQSALVDLDRDVKRLEQLRKRSAATYEPELNLWKARSRVQLLSAKLSMMDDPAVQDELKAALRDLRQQELASVEREIAAATAVIEKQQQKLDRLKRQQVKLKTNDEKWVDQQLKALKQSRKSGSAKSSKVKQAIPDEGPATPPRQPAKAKPPKQNPETDAKAAP